MDYEYCKDYRMLAFHFSYQHVHIVSEFNNIFNYSIDINKVTECIDDFINNHVGAIEFFRDNRNCFGGSIILGKVNYMSVEELAKMFGYKKEHFEKMNFKIRTWDGKEDTDVIIVKEKNGIVCVKTNIE